MTYAANADGVYSYYGPRPVIQTASDNENDMGKGGLKSMTVTLRGADLLTNTAHTVATIPAGSSVLTATIYVDEALVKSGGTASLTLGDAGDADGFITATIADTTNISTDGFTIYSTGVYTVGTGATDRETKLYAAATDLLLTTPATTVWTGGKITLTIVYF